MTLIVGVVGYTAVVVVVAVVVVAVVVVVGGVLQASTRSAISSIMASWQLYPMWGTITVPTPAPESAQIRAI